MAPTATVSLKQGREWLGAAKEGDLALLATLLAGNQALLEHQGSGIGHSAMHWCAAKGYLECLQWLLKQGADMNTLNAEDSTLLHAAAANGQEAVVQYLLEQPETTLTALDSSGETAKQVAESKKWLAIAALIPDQSSRESASAQPHPNNSNHPVLAGNHASTTTPVSQLDQPQLPSDPEQVTPSAADIAPQQMPVGCSQSEDSTGQRAASSTSATGAPFPSSHRGTSHDATGAGLPCQAGNGPQQQPVWQPTPGQEGLSCQLSSCASRQTPNDAGSSSTDVHPPQPCPAKAQGKAWLDAARYGRLPVMKALLHAHNKDKVALVAYNGKGTSYGLMGHTALHWAAAKGYKDTVTWLLEQGADADCPNQGGSTPLHSAVNHGQTAAAEVLVYMGQAAVFAEDDCGDTPMALALSKGHTALIQQLETAQYVNLLRSQPQSSWLMKTVRAVLQRAGVDMAALLERQEVISACQQYLDRLPRPLGACAKVRTSKAVYAASSTATTSTRKVTHLRCDDADDDDGEQSACNTPQQAAEFAKERGNVLYQQAQYQQAISLYSMAINLHVQLALHSQSHNSGLKSLAVLYSNRSAAFASLRRWDEASDDAEQCTSLMPNWSKGHCRAAAAMWAHGQKDMAVAAYKRALALEPTCAPALEALRTLDTQ